MIDWKARRAKEALVKVVNSDVRWLGGYNDRQEISLFKGREFRSRCE